jgi:hypothetical protein
MLFFNFLIVATIYSAMELLKLANGWIFKTLVMMKALKTFVYCLVFINRLVNSFPVLEEPSKDAFYIPPKNFEQSELGTILKYRRSPQKLRSLYFPIEIANSWDILVRSEDSHGNASAVVSTLMEPFNANPKKLVAYNIAQDSSNIDCSPTYAIYGANVFANLAAQAEFSLFAGAVLLREGYFVLTTAFETTASNKAAFTAGRLAGKNILNSIRGVLKSRNFTSLADPQVIFWGFSGGALASAWAVAQADHYAPEMKSIIVGAVLGGLPSNLTETVLASDQTLFAGLIPNGINGLIHEYPYLEPIFKSYMNETQWNRLKRGADYCLLPSILDYAFENFVHQNNSYFKDEFEIFNQEDIAKVLLENTLAVNSSSEIPTIPIFMYHGVWDQIVPFVNSQRVFRNWCEGGASSIEFAIDVTGGHLSDLVLGLPAAAGWIKNRFDGKESVSGCEQLKYISLLSYPNASTQLSELVKGLNNEFLGKKIGPDKRERSFYTEEGFAKLFINHMKLEYA